MCRRLLIVARAYCTDSSGTVFASACSGAGAGAGVGAGVDAGLVAGGDATAAGGCESCTTATDAAPAIAAAVIPTINPSRHFAWFIMWIAPLAMTEGAEFPVAPA